jgi:hypothetical protein
MESARQKYAEMEYAVPPQAAGLKIVIAAQVTVLVQQEKAARVIQ